MIVSSHFGHGHTLQRSGKGSKQTECGFSEILKIPEAVEQVRVNGRATAV